MRFEKLVRFGVPSPNEDLNALVKHLELRANELFSGIAAMDSGMAIDHSHIEGVRTIKINAMWTIEQALAQAAAAIDIAKNYRDGRLGLPHAKNAEYAAVAAERLR